MTTLRALALTTTILVAAAVTCLASFAQIPSPPASPVTPLPTCAASAIALRERGILHVQSGTTISFAVVDMGDACEFPRIPNVSAFDAAGHQLALVQPRRIGVMRFVAVPLRLAHGGVATFTVGMSESGSACARIAKLAIAAGGGNVAMPVDQTACTRPDGSNVTISFLSPESAMR